MAVESKLVEEENIPVDIFTKGNLLECEDRNEEGRFIVMVYEVSSLNFEGVVVFSDYKPYPIGFQAKDWRKHLFKQFQGTITLTGSK